MPKLALQRIPFTIEADNRLRMLKARTGITPNLLCRVGFCLSIEEPGNPPPCEEKAALGREINRFTLLGEYDQLFVSLLAVRMARDGQPMTEMDSAFVSHMNRGVELLTARIKTISDLGRLLPDRGIRGACSTKGGERL